MSDIRRLTDSSRDIHLYLDTSGIISEADWREPVIDIISAAVELGVDLHFTSFSHQLEQTAIFSKDDATIADIYTQLCEVPKALGGTDFTKIWEHINTSKACADQFSIVLTDMQWAPKSTTTIDHPQNLHYVRIPMEHAGIPSTSIDIFADDMRAVVPDIDDRILELNS